MLLRAPVAGISHRLMGRIAPEEKYRRWLVQHRATDPDPASTCGEIDPDSSPLISVVMRVSRPHLPWLREAVNSAREQSYANWQLLAALDGSPTAEILGYLESCARNEPRIRLLPGERAGISATLNRGLNACSGGYTAFLDQDDTLEETALGHAAAAIAREQPDILYTDEDYIDGTGRPKLPIFKPAWSPALLLSCMYFGHLLMAKTGRMMAVGGFRSAHDGAQASLLAQRPGAARFSVYGNGAADYQETLFRFVRDCGIQNSCSLYPKQDPAPIYRGCRAAIVPSEFEPFSMVAIEAMSYAKPVIATRCGGPQEIVQDGKTGYLIPVGDSDALAERMLRLTDNPALARRMGIAGTERMQSVYHIREVAGEYLGHILAVVHKPRSAEDVARKRLMEALIMRKGRRNARPKYWRPRNAPQRARLRRSSCCWPRCGRPRSASARQAAGYWNHENRGRKRRGGGRYGRGARFPPAQHLRAWRGPQRHVHRLQNAAGPRIQEELLRPAIL